MILIQNLNKFVNYIYTYFIFRLKHAKHREEQKELTGNP